MIGLEAAQGILYFFENVILFQTLLSGSHLHADLGCQDDFRALAGMLQPVADDGFRFASGVARNPGGIDVRGIDKIQSGVDESVQDLKGRGLIDGPAKDVSSQHERRDFEA